MEELAGGEVIARSRFARILVKHAYTSTNREVFDCYLYTEEFRKRGKQFKADTRAYVETIWSADGKISLAYSYQMGLLDI